MCYKKLKTSYLFKLLIRIEAKSKKQFFKQIPIAFKILHMCLEFCNLSDIYHCLK